ncbi:MAG: hypothetical protein ABSC38_05205 [Verrucomicrobiia bacterium]
MKNGMPRTRTAFVGLAGTHFAAAELSQRGYVATVTSRNTEGIDILASSADGSRTVSIQVKTSGAEQRSRFTRSWIMQKKHEDVASDNFFYVFVDLKPTNEKPDFYIVPSKEVAHYIKRSHQEWLKKPGRGGKQHNDTTMRLFEIYDEAIAEKYLNKWEILGLSPESARET